MKHKKLLMIILFIGMSTSFSCKKFIAIDPPKNSLVPTTVFKNNDLATSAVLGIYRAMAQSNFASGDQNSISTMCGISADEFIAYSVNLKSLFEHQITPINSPTNNALWGQMYKAVYDANAILEGLENENGITPPIKSQLQGEAYFIRAFCYFYLVNLYGDIPVHLTTDYTVNSKVSRTPTNEVYDRIVTDLKQAEMLLGEDYITTERVRPNKATVQALLAKTYLYTGDWPNAERYANLVIARNTIYQLIAPDQVFLRNSLETIWQLFPTAGGNTLAGDLLIPVVNATIPSHVSLSPDFVEHAFEANDLRRISWVKSFVGNGVTYYYPFKYKVRSSTAVTEYFMVFRLAEQFLIRAEARAQQNNLPGSIEDLDAIRFRAGLSLIKDINPGINKGNLLIAIEKERRVELFSEWGDRWFNLKRTGKADAVLSTIKFGWKPDFVLYPIPYNEVSRNRNIIPNPGY